MDPLQSKYPNLNPFNFCENNPVYFVDKDGKDASYTIDEKSNTITFHANIYIYGKNATKKKAQEIQKELMGVYGADYIYTDQKTGKQYNVKFDINVKKLDKSDKKQMNEINKNKKDGSFNLVLLGDHNNNSKNYETGYGYKGFWDDDRHNNVRSHEFGHMLGFDERYYLVGGVVPKNYSEKETDNIMGPNSNNPSYKGSLKLSQSQIDDLANFAINHQKNGRGKIKNWDGKAENFKLRFGKPTQNELKDAYSNGKAKDFRQK